MNRGKFNPPSRCPILEHSPRVTHTLTQRNIDHPLSPTEPAADSTHQKPISVPLPLALGRATSLLTVLIIGEQGRFSLILNAPWHTSHLRLIARDEKRTTEISNVIDDRALTDQAELAAAEHLRPGDVAWLIENPEPFPGGPPSMFLLPQFATMAQMSGVRQLDCDQCLFGADTVKPTRFLYWGLGDGCEFIFYVLSVLGISSDCPESFYSGGDASHLF